MATADKLVNLADLKAAYDTLVRHDASQTLGDTAKAQARTNIGAADATEAASLKVAQTATSVTAEQVDVTDIADGSPLAFTASIVPLRGGTGTPASDNVRTIYGHVCSQIVMGRKLHRFLHTAGATTSKNGVTVESLGRGWYRASGTVSAYVQTDNISIPKFTKTGTSRIALTNMDSKSNHGVSVVHGSSTQTYNFGTFNNNTTFGVTDNCTAFRFYCNNAESGINTRFCPVVIDGDAEYIQISLTTIAGGTVFGGSLAIDAAGNGVLTVTHKNIASYDGETLPGAWISDRDVYSAGGTPTTGAQVVYELAEAETYTFTVTPITLTSGGAYSVLATCGDVSVSYLCNPSNGDSVTVTGSNPVIIASPGVRYVCSASSLSELDFTPCAEGLCSVRFHSGSTATVLTLPNTVKMPGWWTGPQANTTYEISIADGVFGAVGMWT